ncbi:kinesin-like protein KIF19 isoform X11 [Balaenoptera musculus]|uniref:Kinesin-like protein n=1 Tax=Balaenoptera musculus TaxID=9771 RepID=A0A8B8VD13_BALMU|nr:kinesin-like protein KIF19 isoform X11 [Balaenoptera musculus]
MPNLGWWRSWTPARTLRTHCTHTGPGRRPSSSTLCSTSTPPSKMCTCHPPALSGRRHFWIQRDGVCPRPLRCCQRPVSPGGNEVGGSGALPNSTKHLVCAGLALVPLHPLAPLVLSTALKGASKTHTMLRMDAGPGIYLQMLTDLFQAVEETRESTDCSVSMSCLETTQLLTKGNWQCTQESTATSKMSSRSHAVLQVTVHQRSHGTDMAEEVHIGRLSMVDLAGSELAPQTRNRGKRMKEGVPINRSLPALGNGINALSEKGGSQAQYVNFRDANSRAPAAGQAQPAERVLPHRTVRGRHLRPGQADQAPQGQGGEAGEGEEKHPGGRHAPAAIPPPDTEEDSRLQMKEIRVQLIGGFKEQLEMRRSPVELESTSLELHVDVSHYLPTMAELGWSSVWPKPRRRPRRWSSCRPRRSSARTAGGAATACRARELEVEDTALQANSLCRKNLLCQKDFVIQCCQQHRRLCEQIIQDQRQLIQDVSPHLCFPDSHRRRPRAVPEALEQRYGLHSRELGVDTLNGLLRLHSVMSSALPVCALGCRKDPSWWTKADGKEA